jgi:hypothetical protein
MLARQRRQRIQIEHRQKINRFETPIHGRRAANFRADAPIGAKQLGNFHAFARQTVERAIVLRSRLHAPFGFCKMIPAQPGISRSAGRRILRRDGTATDKVMRTMLMRVIGNALPQQTQDIEIAVLTMDTRPA